MLQKAVNMSNKPRKMTALKLILQSLKNGMSISGISKAHKSSRNTIKGVRNKALKSGKSFEELLEYDELKLEQLFYKKSKNSNLKIDNEILDTSYIEELSNPHMTIQLLYEEYKESGGEISRSSFYERMGQLTKKKKVTFTKERNPGEKLEVDYAGSKLLYINEQGEECYCEVLVCVLPYSNMIYCEAQENQKQGNYINGIGRALLYIGKMPKVVISDNLKSGIKSPSNYEPELTELAEEASQYYGIQITATRVAKPRDKPNVERTVRIVYQRIYAKIRNRTIDSIAELNKIILKELDVLNARQINNKPSRQEIYEKHEAQYMLSLKVTKLMEIRKSRTCKVGQNYHVELTEDEYYYSVPFEYYGEEVRMRYTEIEVEIYHKGVRIALHKRQKGIKRYNTISEHVPANHKAAKEVNGYTKEDLIKMATKIGQNTGVVVEKIIERCAYEQQGYKSSLGVIRLEKKYGQEKLEQACKALKEYKATYTSVKSYLEKNIGNLIVIKGEKGLEKKIIHHNIRYKK